MAKCIIITFPAGRDHFFYSRVLDFGESLYPPVVHTSLGRLSNLDKFTKVVRIELTDPHNLGKVQAIVRKQLAYFKLATDALVSMSAGSPTAE